MKKRAPILVVVGTRPEAIKMLPVIRRLASSDQLEAFVLSTGQHPEAVREVLALADLAPDAELSQATPRSLNELFAGVLRGVERVVQERFGIDPLDPNSRPEAPAWALVHGDTTSAAAGALASFHLRIPLAHVESGLRTRRTHSPFPEELNRQLIARAAAFHLAPTTTNKENLILEGIRSEQVFVTGNTAIDALLWAATLPADRVADRQPDPWPTDPKRKVVTVTAHRRENWDGGLDRIAMAVRRLAQDHGEVTFVLPLHPNPRVGDRLAGHLSGLPNVTLCPPLPYVQFARLLGRSHFAISDSGGVQEEAPALGTPVLVTRESTERREGVFAGTLELVGTDTGKIVAAAHELLTVPARYSAMANAVNPYGDGHAAERIVQALEHLTFRSPVPPRYGSGYSRTAVLSVLGTSGLPTGTQAGESNGEREPQHSGVVRGGVAS